MALNGNNENEKDVERGQSLIETVPAFSRRD
jgi:hypothetical protein